MFSFNCKFTKNCVLAWQLTKFCTMMSYGLFEKFYVVIASTSIVKLKFDMFLKGMGGMRIWFFLAGTLIIDVFSSTLQSFLRHVTSGTSQLTAMGRIIGLVFSSWISSTPLILQLSFTGGTLTATLTWALSLALILNLTSSKYSYLSLLLTEKTYSSRSLNYQLQHLAMTLSKKGWLGGVYMRPSQLKSMQTSTSQIEPGQSVVLPNWTIFRLTLTNWDVQGSGSGDKGSFSGALAYCFSSAGCYFVWGVSGCCGQLFYVWGYSIVRFSTIVQTSFQFCGSQAVDGELMNIQMKRIMGQISYLIYFKIHQKYSYFHSYFIN